MERTKQNTPPWIQGEVDLRYVIRVPPPRRQPRGAVLDGRVPPVQRRQTAGNREPLD